MTHPMRQTAGAFAPIHQTLMGLTVEFGAFNPARFDASLVEQAKAVWSHRAQTEFRSVQILNALLADVLESGDPIDTYAAFHDLVGDEIRHVALCAAMARALGATPQFPTPLALPGQAEMARSPAAERALNRAITMLAVNETLSLGFIDDLQRRCTEPTVAAVLRATVADEASHQELGWTYIRHSLQRFPDSTLPAWQTLTQQALAPHLAQAQRILDGVSPDKRQLAEWPDEERVQLGLYGPQRQALVMQRTLHERLIPQLQSAGLWHGCDGAGR